MKTITIPMQQHLDGVVTSLCTICRIIRLDGTEVYITDHDVDVQYNDGEVDATYVASSGYDRYAIQSRGSLSVDNLDIEGLFNNTEITEADLRAGRYDYAEVRLMMVNWRDTSAAMGDIKLKKGFFGEVTTTQSGGYVTELRGLAQPLAQNILETFSAECRVDLGDPATCKVPILPDEMQRNTVVSSGELYRVNNTGGSTESAYQNRVYRVITSGTTAATQPSYDSTVGNNTTDGTAVLQAEEAYMRHATVTAVTDAFNFAINVSESRDADGWFALGGIQFDGTSSNADITRQCVEWTQTGGLVKIALKFPFDIAVNDTLRLYPGCDKRQQTCSGKFDNIINMHAEPFVPGPDRTISREN